MLSVQMWEWYQFLIWILARNEVVYFPKSQTISLISFHHGLHRLNNNTHRALKRATFVIFIWFNFVVLRFYISVSFYLMMAVASSPPLSWGAVGGEGAHWGPLARQPWLGPVLTRHGQTGACYSQQYASTPLCFPPCYTECSNTVCTYTKCIFHVPKWSYSSMFWHGKINCKIYAVMCDVFVLCGCKYAKYFNPDMKM